MGNSNISVTYHTNPRDRALSAIRIYPSAGDPRRGWLTAGGQTIPVALGRGGIRANKREGDGGTPKGTFRPRQRGVLASGARQFRTDRRMRLDDEIGDAAFVAAARPRDKNCD